MLKYTIATGVDETDILSEYGVHVSGSTGMVGRPNLKNPTHRYNWNHLNGEWIDLSNRRYNTREIKLKCWLKGSNKQVAIDKLNTFIKAFDKNSLIRLHVDFLQNTSGVVQTGMKGLFFLVYLTRVDIKEAKWRSGAQILNFEMTLVEPSPIKRIYTVTGTDVGTVTVTYESTSEFDIHWGDGSVTYDCIGDDSTSHEYEETTKKYIIVTGVINDIESIEFRADTPEITITRIYEEI